MLLVILLHKYMNVNVGILVGLEDKMEIWLLVRWDLRDHVKSSFFRTYFAKYKV